MPDLTGADLVGELLKLKPDIRLMLCTGYSSSIKKNEAEAIGVHQFLTRPFGPTRLAEKDREVLGNR